MSNITYLHGWKPELCTQFDNNLLADFNRLMVKGFPPTTALQLGGRFESANREGFILQMKSRFDDFMGEGKSYQSLYSIYSECSLYLRWCDEYNEEAFTQHATEAYFAFLYKEVLLGKIKRSTYKSKRSIMLRLFCDYLDLPSAYFDSVTITDSSDEVSFEAYTRSDLNQLLPFLRSLFKQTAKQLIENPEKHIDAHKNTPTMTFDWKGKLYKLCGGISKMMCAGTYLLAYYTYANTRDLFQLKQPDNASTSIGEIWYTMPAFKRRAFKTIQVEMGGHELDIPKYAMSFFDTLLEASRLISTAPNAALLQTVVSNQRAPLKALTLQDFLRVWVEKHFTFTDQTGRRLRPVISRFRETGAQITTYHQGELMNDIMLNNTSNTRKKSYSKGNQTANNGMMQDAMSLREQEIKQGESTKEAQESLSIDVLVIEAENKINLPNLSRTPNGGSCSEPFGERSKKFTRKALKHGLIKEGEKLACADLLGCFGCPDQVIVQSLSDIWCLLSFKSCIEESLYRHLDAHHYKQNFEDIIAFIETRILPNLKSSLLKAAEEKMDDEGLHPLWDDAESVLNLVPSQEAF
ncbi:hypothetical protein [Vibrio breoganii]|uniref:hypothetical protein n=1 Tax=Vibrio breoganii TaxID=553239 RepID=UPI000C866E75|nr:hypothetical protein [Vibrio breoganii]PMG07058.1 hypothetical protein BCV08_04560 [Vibrio breoganii]PMG94248.1 hypothetical protein BCU79_12210 [Vibrio breoganii]PMJ49636.1 hypothetical protein BCU21_17870 [Vibrio breoganii]PMK55005.1 hypothetical protein BCT97_00485 [Vibrio breoganii]PMM86415.1 hypothetical protein BCT44_06350 [Vibrio breoganii]